MNSDNFKINSATSNELIFLENHMKKNWGGLPLVIRGKKYDPLTLPSLIASNSKGILGFLFYEIQDYHCEIIVFEIFKKFSGIGSIMLSHFKNEMAKLQCKRIFLMTTNDNLDALRFYQKRGFSICNIHIDSVKESRKIKPTIGLIGDYGIPVRDEIDLEFLL